MSAINVLFAEFLDDAGCSCLRLETDGAVVFPFAHRSYDEIKTMQNDATTLVIVPAAQCGLHDVELPWLSDRNARAALPYALEERLAQPVTTLHFAFDKTHHQHNHYLVAVIDKTFLENLIGKLDEKGIVFDAITLDWFALKPEERIITPNQILVRSDDFSGSLAGDLAKIYLKTLSDDQTVARFQDSTSQWKAPHETIIDDSYYLWIARRLQQQPFINLCQGALKHVSQQKDSKQTWLKAFAMLAGTWLFLFILINLINVIRLNIQMKEVDNKIAQVYRQFFPGAQQIISPRFRITQLLKSGHARQDNNTLWRFMEAFDKAIDTKRITVLQLDFKSNRLSITLKGPDFSALDELASRLKRAHVNVEQSQAQSYDDYVSAVLELHS